MLKTSHEKKNDEIELFLRNGKIQNKNKQNNNKKKMTNIVQKKQIVHLVVCYCGIE